MNIKTKNENPQFYGYEHPWNIPGNEGCGIYNPINKGKTQEECPKFKVNFIAFTDADEDTRYCPAKKDVADFFQYENRNKIRQKDTDSRCVIPSKKFRLKKCREDCNNCPYKQESRTGLALSLDWLCDDYNYQVSDGSFEEHEEIFETESLIEEIRDLLESKDSIDKTLASNFDKTNEYIAKLVGTSSELVRYRRKRLIQYLQKNLKK